MNRSTRRIALWLLSTLTAVVLLFGYHTSTEGAGAAASAPLAVYSGSTSSTTSSSASSGTSSSTSSTSTSGTGSSKKSGTTTTRTVTGETAETRWGPVQVELTYSGSTITAVDVLQYPNGNPRDGEINSVALPQLISETLSAQSAQIDAVSGATYTSDGYLQSLQSALDQA